VPLVLQARLEPLALQEQPVQVGPEERSALSELLLS